MFNNDLPHNGHSHSDTSNILGSTSTGVSYRLRSWDKSELWLRVFISYTPEIRQERRVEGSFNPRVIKGNFAPENPVFILKIHALILETQVGIVKCSTMNDENKYHTHHQSHRTLSKWYNVAEYLEIVSLDSSYCIKVCSRQTTSSQCHVMCPLLPPYWYSFMFLHTLCILELVEWHDNKVS